jgi:hypothetical protein
MSQKDISHSLTVLDHQDPCGTAAPHAGSTHAATLCRAIISSSDFLNSSAACFFFRNSNSTCLMASSDSSFSCALRFSICNNAASLHAVASSRAICSAALCASSASNSASLASSIASVSDNHSFLIASALSSSVVFACINANSSSNAALLVASISESVSSAVTSTNLDDKSAAAHAHRSDILVSISAILSADDSIAFVKSSITFSLSLILSHITSKASSFCCLALSFSASLSIFASSFCLSDSIFSSSLASFSAAILAADLPHPPPELVLVPHTGVTNDSAHTDCAFCLSHCSAAEILSIPSALSNHFCTFNADINT